MAAPDPYNLQRFVDAQQGAFDNALAELREGQKRGHWMWFVFPQLADLGRSDMAKFFGLASLDEARAYLQHALLGVRLRQSVQAILPWSGRRTAEQIFGTVDSMKLRSSLTLFGRVDPGGLFDQGLMNFFAGERDELSLALLDGGH
jgi:uncharacterized protein (DUF1810 family)